MSSKAKHIDFEKALAELEALVMRLEEGKSPLDESIRQFERAMNLAKSCQAALAAAEQKIEMLFIHPDRRGKGIGRLLTEFAINELNADKVDVNEQNDQAVGFYQRMGFIIEGRTDKDGMGRPYPLLQMKLAPTK